MNVIGALVLLIAVASISIFGMGAISSMMDSGDDTINNSSSMYDSYTTAKNVTSISMSFMGFMPYLIGLCIVIGIVAIAVSMIPK